MNAFLTIPLILLFAALTTAIVTVATMPLTETKPWARRR